MPTYLILAQEITSVNYTQVPPLNKKGLSLYEIEKVHTMSQIFRQDRSRVYNLTNNFWR